MQQNPSSRGANSDFVLPDEIIELSLLGFILIDQLRQQLPYLKNTSDTRQREIE